MNVLYIMGISQVVLLVKNLTANAGNLKDKSLNPGSGRFQGGRHATAPVFLPGESHRQRSLMGYST